MAESGIGSSDENFISFLFAIVSVLLMILYIPWIIGNIRSTYLYKCAPKKMQTAMEHPLKETWDSLTYLPRIAKKISENPSVLLAGAKLCIKEKYFFLVSIMPRFLIFVCRPRIFLPIIWFALFSSTMYTTLTFDAHAILGINKSASTADIKKAYRALSKRYHPDHNKDEGSRNIYIQVRRAYKSLVDHEAFEKEETQNFQDHLIGVALPRFLTSREHDGLVLFGLLGVLIAVPLFIWYKFSNDKKISNLISKIRLDKERVERFMIHFRIPEDSKYVERSTSRRMILNTLVSLKILPPYAHESVVNNFPPLLDFVQRCIDSENNHNSLLSLGLSDDNIDTLHAEMLKNGVQIVENYTHDIEQRLSNTFLSRGESLNLLTHSEYLATLYLFRQHTDEVDNAVMELQKIMEGSNLPSTKKLLNLHRELYDLLEMLYEKGIKHNKQVLAKLIEMPQRVSDLVDAIESDIKLAYRRYTNYIRKQWIQQQKTQLRSTRTSKNA